MYTPIGSTLLFKNIVDFIHHHHRHNKKIFIIQNILLSTRSDNKQKAAEKRKWEKKINLDYGVEYLNIKWEKYGNGCGSKL